MTNAERKLWLKLAESIHEKILSSRPLSDHQLQGYWKLRHIDPIIKMRWDAETKVLAAPEGGVGVIQFPNGNTLHFQSRQLV
jgi:hypothetical protein